MAESPCLPCDLSAVALAKVEALWRNMAWVSVVIILVCRAAGRPAYGGKNAWIYPPQVEYVAPKKIAIEKAPKGFVYWAKAS